MCVRVFVFAFVFFTSNLKTKQKLQQRNEMIAHLKDQLQEMKAKTSMEGKYIKKDAEVRIVDSIHQPFYKTFIKYLNFKLPFTAKRST